MSAQTTTAGNPAGKPSPTVTAWLAAAVDVLAVQLASLREEVDTLPRDTTDTSSLSSQLDDVCRLLGSAAGSARVHQAFTGHEAMGSCEQAAAEAATGHTSQ